MLLHLNLMQELLLLHEGGRTHQNNTNTNGNGFIAFI